jgi:putative transposase
VKFGFVAKHRGAWAVNVQCEALGVSCSGFYAWRKRPLSTRARTDAAILQTIRARFVLSDSTYGARRMLDEVREAGHACGRQRVARLMRSAALRARPRRRATPADTGVRALHLVAPNVLDRQFTATAPNQKWVADFTYVWTGEGWLYVAVVLDLFSRRIVGWSMQAAMTSQLVTDALLMAVWRRGPATALLHHSDQGSQGGFKRSSQHPPGGGCDVDDKTAVFSSSRARRVAIAGPALGGRT